MNDDERFEQLWNDYLEGELDEIGIEDLQRLFASDETFLKAAADSLRVHRLLGLNAADSEKRHDEFVRATMAKLPAGGSEFVEDVMRQLPERVRAQKRSRSVLLSAMAVAALLLIGGLLFFMGSAAPEVARITGLHGSFQWTGAGGIVQEVTKAGHVINGGTLEALSADAWADLQFRDGTTLTVSGRSLLTLSQQGQKVVRLRYGNVSAKVAPQPAGRPMLVQTPAAELNVLGTQFNVDARPEATRLVVNEGRVRLKRLTDDKQVDVEASHELTASIGGTNGLVPIKRRDAITTWKSDLESDVVRGKWVSDLWLLGKRLKQAVATGQMGQREALAAFKAAASLDEQNGSVWAASDAVGSLIVLSVSRSSAAPVVLTQDARFRVAGRIHTPENVTFGITVHNQHGGFAGKYCASVPADALRGDGNTFDLEIPVSDLQEITGFKGSSTDKELRDWWCVAEHSKLSKLEILSVELVEE